VDLFEAGHTRNRGVWVFVEWTPVPSEIKLLVDVEFLVTKEDDTSFCSEKGPKGRKYRRCSAHKLKGTFDSQFIFLNVGQLPEIDPM